MPLLLLGAFFTGYLFHWLISHGSGLHPSSFSRGNFWLRSHLTFGFFGVRLLSGIRSALLIREDVDFPFGCLPRSFPLLATLLFGLLLIEELRLLLGGDLGGSQYCRLSGDSFKVENTSDIVIRDFPVPFEPLTRSPSFFRHQVLFVESTHGNIPKEGHRVDSEPVHFSVPGEPEA